MIRRRSSTVTSSSSITPARAVKSLGFPIFMSESPARLASLAPCRGQHTAQVLRELLGYPAETIHELGTQACVA
jgi:crotonobetainyl-CoA:carnitine CoA-transferase CaiB-like acyl-CoA transferase